MAEKGKEIACVILEPVAGNMGMVAPDPQFLKAVRREDRNPWRPADF